MENKKVDIKINYRCQTRELEKANRLLGQFQKALNELKKTGIIINVLVIKNGNGKEGRKKKKV